MDGGNASHNFNIGMFVMSKELIAHHRDWIAINKAVPLTEIAVMVRRHGRNYNVARWDTMLHQWSISGVTHWMPLEWAMDMAQ